MSADSSTKVAVIAACSSSVADGIRDYSERLVANLEERPGIDVQLFQRDHRAFATRVEPAAARGFSDCSSADAVVLQYNPFWYGRRGFAPGLPIGVLRLRRSAPGATIALMVHETYVDPKNWKWALMRAWQRTQLRALQRLADIQLCSIEEWTTMLRRSAPRVPAHHLPVPSNLPDRRCARAASRARLEIGDDCIVLATFGMRHPGRLTDRMLDAARAVRAAGRRVAILNLGTGEATRATLPDGVTLISTGFLEAPHAAEALAAADIFMAAFADGVSTRRGTLMAALQHEIAVVGTVGHLTDSILREARQALRLTPVDRPDLFVSAVAELAADPARRCALARAGRAMYEERFDWPIVVDALLEALEETRA
jgi:glycosyltransferase involved in cell wall biosynthesis